MSDDFGSDLPPESDDWTQAPLPPQPMRRSPSRRGTPILPGRASNEITGVRVYRRNGDGSEVACGKLDIADATEENIIDRFLAAMPQPGEGTVKFRIVPITLENDEIPSREKLWSVDADHLYLVQRRAEAAAAPTASGDGVEMTLIRALQSQLTRQADELAALRRENNEVIREGLRERERHMGLVHTDVSEGYRGVMEAHREAIKTVQTDISGGYDRVLSIQKDAAEAERMRIKAESDAKVAMARAEADATVSRVEAQANLERDRLASAERVALANIGAEKDRLRLEAKEREDRDATRRREEEAERTRREAKEREDAIKREEQSNRMFELTQAFFERSQTQAQAHMEVQLALVKAKSEGDNPLGGAAKLLAMFGMTPADAFTFIKGALGGGGAGGGWAEKLIEQGGATARELLKTARTTARLQAGMEDAEEDDGEEGDEEQAEPGAPRAITSQDRPLPTPGAPVPAPAAAISTPASTPAPVKPKSKLSKPVLRKVRDVVASLVEALKAEEDQAKWPSIIAPALAGSPETLEWLREESIEGALRDVQADPEMIIRILSVLDASGMVPGDIPRRVKA